MATSRHATRDNHDVVDLYLTDIVRHALLSKDDEIELAQRIEAGAEARRRLESRAPSTPAEQQELTCQARDGDAAHLCGGESAPGRLDRQALPVAGSLTP